jgi:hypothetical protein
LSKVYFDLSMPLDGFVTGPNVGVDNPLGDDGERLHDWMFDGKTPTDAELVDELYATTGALVIRQAQLRPGRGAVGRDPPHSACTEEAR